MSNIGRLLLAVAASLAVLAAVVDSYCFRPDCNWKRRIQQSPRPSANASNEHLTITVVPSLINVCRNGEFAVLCMVMLSESDRSTLSFPPGINFYWQVEEHTSMPIHVYRSGTSIMSEFVEDNDKATLIEIEARMSRERLERQQQQQQQQQQEAYPEQTYATTSETFSSVSFDRNAVYGGHSDEAAAASTTPTTFEPPSSVSEAPPAQLPLTRRYNAQTLYVNDEHMFIMGRGNHTLRCQGRDIASIHRVRATFYVNIMDC